MLLPNIEEKNGKAAQSENVRKGFDRRIHSRLEIGGSVELSMIDDLSPRILSPHTTRLIDLSPRGIRLETPALLSPGRSVRIHLTFGDHHSIENIQGAVAWASTMPREDSPNGTAPYSCGIQFMPLDEEQRARIQSVIDESLHSRRSRRLSVNRRRYEYFDRFMTHVDETGIGYEPPVAESAPRPIVTISGRDILQLCSNNSLGLSLHPLVVNAAAAALTKFGTGCGGSRLISGNLILQQQLENRVARFIGFEDAMVFMTGYMANLGIIEALTNIHNPMRVPELDKVVALFTDHENHRSIIHGCQIASVRNHAIIRTYRHLDVNQLEHQLKTTRTSRKVIITEGLFSMRGDLAPLQDISRLATKHHALLFLDDSHAIGHIGATGRGSIEHWGVKDVDVVLGTFSKAFGAAGGFIATRSILTQYFRLQANPYIFSSALPPATVAGVREAINVFDEDPAILAKFRTNVAHFHRLIKDLGFDTLGTQSHITPVFIGPEDKAMKIADDLFAQGIFIPAIRWPAVAPGKAILRCMVSAQHTLQQLDYAVDILGKLGRKYGII